MCLVAWPLSESEAGVDLVLIETPSFSYAVLMLTCRNLHKKSSDVSIKSRSTPASLSFKGQATKHTTVKFAVVCSCFLQNHNFGNFTLLFFRVQHSPVLNSLAHVQHDSFLYVRHDSFH